MSIVVVLLDCTLIPLPYFFYPTSTCALMSTIVSSIVGRVRLCSKIEMRNKIEMCNEIEMHNGRETRASVLKGLVL